MWTTPAATEMRFGFEVTMFVMNKLVLINFKKPSARSLGFFFINQFADTICQ